MTWRPISTAPKDGTRIDLWAAERERYIPERVTDCWFMYGQWVHHRTIYDDETADDIAPLYHATHWMPLPEAPKEAVLGGASCQSSEHAMPETTPKGEQPS